MAFSGVDIRQTNTYVTDPAGCTYSYENGGTGDAYPTTRGGLTFGWTVVPTGNWRDRNAGLDARLAGMLYNVGPGTQEFKFDLPSGAGTYNVRLALGDDAAGWAHVCVIKDSTTTLATVSGSTSAAQWLDAGGTARSAASWVSSNVALNLTFATTQMRLVLGDGTGGVNSTIAHVALEFVGAGGAANDEDYDLISGVLRPRERRVIVSMWG